MYVIVTMLAQLIERGITHSSILGFLDLKDVFHLAVCSSRIFLVVLQKIRRIALCTTVIVTQHLISAMQTRSAFTERLLRSVKTVITTRELLTASVLTRLGIESSTIEKIQSHRLSGDAARNCFNSSLFPNLIHLHLGGIAYVCGNLTDLSIRNILSGVGQQLQSLKFIKLPEITGLAFDCISFFCSNRLKELRIVCCAGLLNSFRVTQLKQFITTCGINLTILDIRYSIEVTDEFLYTLRVYKLNHLEVFLGSRSKLYESLVNSDSEYKVHQLKKLRVIPILSYFVWVSFLKTYASSKLLYIDDVTAEAYGTNKPRFIARRGIDEVDENRYVDSMPIPTQLLLTKAQTPASKKRPMSPLPYSEDLVCDECIPFLQRFSALNLGKTDCNFACQHDVDSYATWIHYDESTSD